MLKIWYRLQKKQDQASKEKYLLLVLSLSSNNKPLINLIKMKDKIQRWAGWAVASALAMWQVIERIIETLPTQ
jgi:hypothetical protein